MMLFFRRIEALSPGNLAGKMIVTGFFIVVLGFSSQAWAESSEEPAEISLGRSGQHCLGEQESKLVLHQLIGGQYNPWGVENTMSLGLCRPLIESPGILFDYTNIEIGLSSILSPVYNHIGPYIQITPLSVLELRAEATWLVYWPFFFDRAGYFGTQSYDSDYRNAALPSENAETATGFNITFSAVLQARVPIGPLALVVFSQLTYEFWKLGEAPYYVNLKRDLILAQRDWVLTNEAIFCLEIPINSNFNIRVGAFDSLRYVPSSEELNNLVGGMVMFNVPRGRRSARDISPFVRVGGYTNHVFRGGEVSAVVGLIISYDVASVPAL